MFDNFEVKVIAGDLKHCSWYLNDSSTPNHMYTTTLGTPNNDRIHMRYDVRHIEVIDQHTSPSVMAAAGWGVAGAALLGPAGLVAGALLGGRKEKMVFSCTLKDGRKFLAVTNKKTWTKIQAIRFTQ